MIKLTRTIRAFFLALKMTLKGEALQPAELRYPQLDAWRKRALQLANAVLQTATINGMDHAAREAFTVMINHRPMSMEVILQATRHNMHLEYPMLMEARIGHNLTTLYAMNLDDGYRVSQLATADELDPTIKAALRELAEHLQAIPPSNQT